MPQTLRKTFASEEQKTQNAQEYSLDYAPVSYGVKRYEEIKKLNYQRKASLKQEGATNDTWIYSYSATEEIHNYEAMKNSYASSITACKSGSPELSFDLSDEDQYFEFQAKLFDKMKADLETNFNNQYVLFENGTVLYSGTTRAIVAKQAYEKLGMRPLFIEKVGGKSEYPEIYTPIFFDKCND